MPSKKVVHKLGAVSEDGTPKLGMKFEDSRKKLLKFRSSRENPQLKESLIGQVELHEGVNAAEDLRKEVNFKYDEERKIKPMDFIHNPNGRLQTYGVDFGKPRIFAWCNECGQRAYIYSIIKDDSGRSILRCNRCGTDCQKVTKEMLELMEGNNG